MRALLIGVVTSRAKESKLETLESTLGRRIGVEIALVLSCFT